MRDPGNEVARLVVQVYCRGGEGQETEEEEMYNGNSLSSVLLVQRLV